MLYLLYEIKDLTGSEVVYTGDPFGEVSLHCVGFARTSLPICEAGDLGAFEGIVDEWSD